MDATTMGAVLAAMPTQRALKYSVSEALTLAAETLKPATLKRSPWLRRSGNLTGSAPDDRAWAHARAGDRVILCYDPKERNTMQP